ncbi:MAG: PfkB family carbohydrate kinase [Pikeienuella sp.]|uniref:PfkB family carbohydrate kinase n=1 Tax=Pikeienuella sp. TaxID=2831957 RepID=UPI00391D95B8
MTILVCGALHLDIVVSAPRLPRLDETVAGGAVREVEGGKGGNQARAAALMGAPTAFAGRIGADGWGERLLAGLVAAGVDASRVARDPGASGMSVAIEEPGGYGAVIVSGANLRIDPAEIEPPAGLRLLLLQNEIPEEANLALARRARAMGARVLLNAAPARPLSPALRAVTDILVVNRVEAEDMAGAGAAPEAAARALAAEGPGAVIVTLGAAGLMLAAEGAVAASPAFPVSAKSSHGAGDMFVGALAARLHGGAPLAEAARFGQAAAALFVSGAAPAPEAAAALAGQSL